MDFIANPFGRMAGEIGASTHNKLVMVRVREGSVQKIRPTTSQVLVRSLRHTLALTTSTMILRSLSDVTPF